MKCLIVEDDPISSQVLKKMICKFGAVDAVDNGQQAIDLFRQAHESNSPYDLILMDIMMPEVDGLQAVLEIRKMDALMNSSSMRKVQIIMTTALDDPRTVMKALYESEADSYLVKPIRLEKLVEELRMLKLIAVS